MIVTVELPASEKTAQDVQATCNMKFLLVCILSKPNHLFRGTSLCFTLQFPLPPPPLPWLKVKNQLG